MKKLFLLISCFLILCLASSGCSAVVSLVEGIFATPTPTPTPTPTATPTPTTTPTPTATPKPPVSLDPCPHFSSCGNSYNINEFISSTIQSGVEYPVTIPYDVVISFHAGWIAQDDFTLQQNLKNMTPFLEVDGQSYFLEEFLDTEPYYDPNGYTYASSWVGVVIRGWKISEIHRIRLGYIINARITDGWYTYEPGTKIEYIYLVNPQFIPTVTLTPTLLPTSTPIPRPTAKPATATPSCSVDSFIYINNKTGGTLTLYLTGPAKFTFYVSNGSQSINVCEGTYSYTAYGCGGASKTGTMSSGETHDFWCQ